MTLSLQPSRRCPAASSTGGPASSSPQPTRTWRSQDRPVAFSTAAASLRQDSPLPPHHRPAARSATSAPYPRLRDGRGRGARRPIPRPSPRRRSCGHTFLVALATTNCLRFEPQSPQNHRTVGRTSCRATRSRSKSRGPVRDLTTYWAGVDSTGRVYLRHIPVSYF